MDFRYVWVLCLTFLCTHTTTFNVVHAINGPDDVWVERGDDTQLRCEDTSGTCRLFTWYDVETGVIIYSGSTKSLACKYTNFNLKNLTDSLSVLAITGIEIEDDGEYQCRMIEVAVSFDAIITVEVRSTVTLSLPDSVEENVETIFECSAIGGRPQETISFYIIAKNGTQTGPLSGVSSKSTPNTDTDLTDTTATLTYAPTRIDQTLSCWVYGHQVPDLNQHQNEPMNVSYRLEESALSVTIDDSAKDQLVITCNVTYEPNPPINDYLILLNSSDVISNSSSNPWTLSPKPSYDIELTCSVTNGIGDRTIVSATYIAAPGGNKPNVAAIAGGVCGGFVAIILIVVIVCIRWDD